MAFLIQNWSEVSSSMNQGLVTTAVATPSSDAVTQIGSMNVFCYFSPTDTVATISAANYFLPNQIGLEVDDIIFVTGTDSSTILQVATNVLPGIPPSFLTTGTITTTTFLPGGTIVFMTTTTFTNAQLLGMFATPVQLVPAPGAGNLLIFDKAVLDYHFLTAATAGGGGIQVQYGNTADGAGPAASATVAAATLNGFTGNSTMIVGGVTVSQADTAVYNEGLFLSNATGPFTTGAGTLTVYTYYRMLTPA